MATCNITAGRNEVCKDSVGGLQGVYFLNFTTGSATKNGSGEMTALPSGSTVYYYELKGNSAAILKQLIPQEIMVQHSSLKN
jgi:hypothetical protein